MHEGEDIFGRRLSREVVREQVVDETTGEEFVCEHISETLDRFDGAVESVRRTGGKLLACGHVHQPGQRMARCDACSKEAGQTVYVCEVWRRVLHKALSKVHEISPTVGGTARRVSSRQSNGTLPNEPEASPAFLSQPVCARPIPVASETPSGWCMKAASPQSTPDLPGNSKGTGHRRAGRDTDLAGISSALAQPGTDNCISTFAGP